MIGAPKNKMDHVTLTNLPFWGFGDVNSSGLGFYGHPVLRRFVYCVAQRISYRWAVRRNDL